MNDKCKKFISILRERGVEDVKTIFHALKEFYMFNSALVGQKRKTKCENWANA